jgi:hypothetical protein
MAAITKKRNFFKWPKLADGHKFERGHPRIISAKFD